MTNGLKQSFCAACPQMHIATAGCFEKSQDQIQRCRQQSWAFKQVERMSMDPEDCKQLFSKVRWKKVFGANGKITRFWSFERSGGKASFCTFDNFQKPGITETGNRKRGLSGFRTARGGKAHILKVKMPLIQWFIKQIALLSLLFVGRSTTWCHSSCLSNQVLTRLSTFTVCIAIAVLNLIYASACSWQRRPFWQMQRKDGQSRQLKFVSFFRSASISRLTREFILTGKV